MLVLDVENIQSEENSQINCWSVLDVWIIFLMHKT